MACAWEYSEGCSILWVTFVVLYAFIYVKHHVMGCVCFDVRSVCDRHTQWLCNGGLSRVIGMSLGRDIVNCKGGRGLW